MDAKQFSKKPTLLRKTIRSETSLPKIIRQPSTLSNITQPSPTHNPNPPSQTSKLSIQTPSLLDSPSTAPTPIEVVPSKPSADSTSLIQTMKLSLRELQEETKKYKESFESSSKAKQIGHKSKESLTIPDTLESEHRASFLLKSEDSALNLSSIKQNIQTLQSKISLSQQKVLETSLENMRLKEIVHKIECKLEKRRMFNENINISPCTINCQII